MQLILAAFAASSLHTTLFISVNKSGILGFKVKICHWFMDARVNRINAVLMWILWTSTDCTCLWLCEQRLIYGHLCKGWKWKSASNHLKMMGLWLMFYYSLWKKNWLHPKNVTLCYIYIIVINLGSCSVRARVISNTRLHVKYCCSKISVLRELPQCLQHLTCTLCCSNSAGQLHSCLLWAESRKPQSVKGTHVDPFRILKTDQVVTNSDKRFS